MTTLGTHTHTRTERLTQAPAPLRHRSKDSLVCHCASASYGHSPLRRGQRKTLVVGVDGALVPTSLSGSPTWLIHAPRCRIDTERHGGFLALLVSVIIAAGTSHSPCGGTRSAYLFAPWSFIPRTGSTSTSLAWLRSIYYPCRCRMREEGRSACSVNYLSRVFGAVWGGGRGWTWG
jgi:hypothetical protein